MEKTISINISGVVFYIEENGYNKLKQYLNSIQKYFSSYADSAEILSDIESRIAEKFITKQKSEFRQVITETDVNELILSMGTVADFEALEDNNDETYSQNKTTEQFLEETPLTQKVKTPKPFKIYRDLKRKLIGGVAAGVANHYSIDVLWLRLALLFFCIGSTPTSGILNLNLDEFFAILSSIVFITYIAAWIALPGSTTLEEDQSVKKFYRNPEGKVLGGVAAGVATYFNLDKGIVRFMWVLAIFLFGFGLLAYLVLWIIAPSAKTLTQKMEQQGEAITLTNIDNSIKKSNEEALSIKSENIFSRILLLPFRAISALLNVLGKIFSGLLPLLRVLTGLFLAITAGIFLITIIIALATIVGLVNLENTEVLFSIPAPIHLLLEMPWTLIISFVLLIAMPIITLLLIGIMLITRRAINKSTVWLTIAGIWVVGIVGSIVTGIQFQRNFAIEDSIVDYQQFVDNLDEPEQFIVDANIHDDSRVPLRVSMQGMTDSYVTIPKENGKQDTIRNKAIQIRSNVKARGFSNENAKENASKIKYEVSRERTVNGIILPATPLFSKEIPFRDQFIDLTILIPAEKPFIMSNYFYNQVLSHNTTIHEEYNFDDYTLNWDKLLWKFNKEGKLVCSNIDEFRKKEENSTTNSEAFQSISLNGNATIEIKQGEKYAISTEGDAPIPEIKDGHLAINITENNDDSKKWRYVITTPSLSSIEATGNGTLIVHSFQTDNKVTVDISGSTQADLDLSTPKLTFKGSTFSTITLRGTIPKADITLSELAQINAEKAQIESASITTVDKSKATIGRINQLKTDKRDASAIVTP